MQPLAGRVVLITGSSRGIGLATARQITAGGGHVVLHGRDQAALGVATAALRADGASVDAIAEDLAVPGAGERLIAAAVARAGRVDVLVNNAVHATPRLLADALPEAELARALATNVVAPFGTAAALIAWAQRTGSRCRVLNISSGATTVLPPRALDYVASKQALEAMTRALAQDVDGERACVSALQLGAVRDPHDAASAIVRAIAMPIDAAHGRVFAAWRLDADPEGETRFASPHLATAALDLSAADTLASVAGPSPTVRAALTHFAASPLERLPDPTSRALRAAIAQQQDVPIDSIVVGSGISDLAARVLDLVACAGETVITNAPSWPLVATLCAARQLNVRAIPYRIEGDRGTHDLPAIANAVTAMTRAIYLVSPALPTGDALDREPFAAWIEALPPHVVVIVDEAYVDFCVRPDALRAVAWVRRGTRPLIVLRSFSKSDGLAALRIGYAVAPPTIATRLRAAALPFGVNAAAEVAAIAAIGDGAHRAAAVATNTAERARVEAAIDRIQRAHGADGVARLRSDAPFLLVAAKRPQLLSRFAFWPIAAREENDRRLRALEEDHGIS